MWNHFPKIQSHIISETVVDCWIKTFQSSLTCLQTAIHTFFKIFTAQLSWYDN